MTEPDPYAYIPPTPETAPRYRMTRPLTSAAEIDRLPPRQREAAWKAIRKIAKARIDRSIGANVDLAVHGSITEPPVTIVYSDALGAEADQRMTQERP